MSSSLTNTEIMNMNDRVIKCEVVDTTSEETMEVEDSVPTATMTMTDVKAEVIRDVMTAANSLIVDGQSTSADSLSTTRLAVIRPYVRRGKPIHKCTKCEQKFVSEATCYLHMCCHGMDNPLLFPCEFCDFSTRSRRTLTRHINEGHASLRDVNPRMIVEEKLRNLNRRFASSSDLPFGLGVYRRLYHRKRYRTKRQCICCDHTPIATLQQRMRANATRDSRSSTSQTVLKQIKEEVIHEEEQPAQPSRPDSEIPETEEKIQEILDFIEERKSSTDSYKCRLCDDRYPSARILRKCHTQFHGQQAEGYHRCDLCNYSVPGGSGGKLRLHRMRGHLEATKAELERALLAKQQSSSSSSTSAGQSSSFGEQNYGIVKTESILHPLDGSDPLTAFGLARLHPMSRCEYDEQSSSGIPDDWRAGLLQSQFRMLARPLKKGCGVQPLYYCRKCTAHFCKPSHARRHAAEHGAMGIYKCRYCDYATNRPRAIGYHESMNHSDSEHGFDREKLANGYLFYKCCKCPFTAERRYAIVKHVTYHRAVPARHVCRFCDYSDNVRHIVKVHETFSHTDEFHKSETLDPMYVPKIFNTANGLRCYQCTKCAFTSISHITLRAHMVQHDRQPPNQFTCSVCDYSIGTLEQIHHHERRHHPDLDWCQYTPVVCIRKQDWHRANAALRESTGSLLISRILKEQASATTDAGDIGCSSKSVKTTTPSSTGPSSSFVSSLLEPDSELIHYRTGCIIKTDTYSPAVTATPTGCVTNVSQATPVNPNPRSFMSSLSSSGPPDVIPWNTNLKRVATDTNTTVPPTRPTVSRWETVCPLCPFETPRMDGILQHLEYHGRVPPYKVQCRVCSYSTESRANMTKHEKLHNDRKSVAHVKGKSKPKLKSASTSSFISSLVSPSKEVVSVRMGVNDDRPKPPPPTSFLGSLSNRY